MPFPPSQTQSRSLSSRRRCSQNPSFPLIMAVDLNVSPNRTAVRSPKKVKLLCSYGGRILPRSGDGDLRYAGGHTRIISVPRDVSFDDLIFKISSSAAARAPVSLKYQLPDEDLETLISVSCPEDLEVMMEEYEKLAADGSQKLRTFLFSADLSDARQSYIEAVNSVAGVRNPNCVQREESTISGIGGTSHHESRLGFLGLNVATQTKNPFLLATPSQTCIDPNPSCVQRDDRNPNCVQREESTASTASCTRSSESTISGIEDTSHHESRLGILGLNVSTVVGSSTQNPNMLGTPLQACVDPNHGNFINYQPSEIASGPSNTKLVPIAPNPCMPYPWIANNHLDVDGGVLKPIQATTDHLDENPYGGRVLQTPSHLPTLPFYPQDQNFEHCGLNRMPPQETMLSFEDCFMCRKVLPHAHSDTMIKRHEKGSNGGIVEMNEPICNHHFDDFRRLGVPPLVTSAFSVNVIEPKVMAKVSERSALQKIPVPPKSLGLFESPHGILSDLLPTQVITEPLGVDVSFVRNKNPQQLSEPPIQGTNNTLCNFPSDYVKPLSAMMEVVNISPNENSRFNEQWKAVAKPISGNSKGLEPYRLPAVINNKSNLGPPAEIFDELSPNPLNVARSPNHHVIDTAQLSNLIANYGPFPNNLGLGNEEPLLWVPTYPCSSEAACNSRTIDEIPTRGHKVEDEVSQHYTKYILNQTTGCERGDASFLSSGTSDSSLFSNDDPWKVIGGTHLLPPRPIKMADQELDNPEDSGIDEFPLNRMNSDIIALLEEGKFNPQLDLLRKDFSQEPSPPIEGLGVPASVLQSSISPFSILSAYEIKENPQFIEERGNVDGDADSVEIAEQQIEDVPLDDINMNLQDMEAIEHLQIIRSYDLEELRELGSGTFGTVYHGKWRGSDVAIKRVSNRCFAGKPSEQERMRADFWNEARKLAELHHPNVLAFYGIVLDGPGGSVATVTEYMVNGSLRNALQRNDKAFGWRKRLLVAKDVAFGMEYLHEKNIVHFDLKSDNLLVNLRDPQRPICKVGDLGLSKVKRQTLISGGVRGTLPWMAPELLNGCSNLVSEKVDVFSFGIVMWELLTGEEPYEDLHYGAIIGGIVSNTLRPLVPEWCDPQWRSLMERCWSAEPSDRPSFTEISATLRVVARAVSTPHRKGSP